MQVRPLSDRVLVKRLQGEEKTAGGIIIPDTAKEKPIEGLVVAVGTGKRNTQAILKGCADKNSAAKLASSYRGGGKSDWFLPSKDELNLMHEKLHRKGVGGFKEEGYYWSSSEESEVSSWYQGFRKGNQSNYHKDFKRCVRAVRSF